MKKQTTRSGFFNFSIAGFVWLGSIVLIAGIVHIVSILMMPRVASKNAYARIAAVAPVNQIYALPMPVPGTEVVPFEDASMEMAVCRWSLDQGPIRLRGNVSAERLTLLSFHSRQGQIFYSLSDRSSTRGRIDVLLVNQAQLEAAEANDNEDDPAQELRILAPATEGFILLQALAERPADRPEAQRRLQSFTCGTAR